MPELPTAAMRRDRWLFLLPSATAALLVGPMVATYIPATFQFPPGGLRAFLFTIALVIPMSLAFVALQMMGRLRTVWQLADGKLEGTKAQRQQALREVVELPRLLFRREVINYLLPMVVVDAALALFVRDVQGAILVRIALIAMTLCPMTSFMVRFGTSLAGRRMVRHLAKGLTLEEVMQIHPPRRLRLRRALVAFTLAYTLPPLFLIADAAHSIHERGLEELIAASDAAQPEIAERVVRDSMMPGLVLGALAVTMAVITASVAGSAMSAPMREIAARAIRIGQGQLERVEIIPAEEDVWVISTAFTAMQGQLGEAIGRLQQASTSLSVSSNQLVGTFTQQNEGSTEQATALNQTSATTEELARSASQIAESATNVAAVAERTLVAALAGERSSDLFSAAMGRMRADNQAVADAVVKLNKRVQQIGKVVEFINEIADKSDLLALNAELEGTKAGEVGRGFSLVAAEMRRLAENVLASTREIARLIQEIRDATNAAVIATEAGLKATSRGESAAAQVQQALRQILQLARETSDAVRAISLATQQQTTGTNQLAEAMSDVLRVTSQGALATAQMSDANVELSALAKELKTVVARFEVNHG